MQTRELDTDDFTHPGSILGKKAMIKEDNDNENYEKFRGKTLIITHAERGGRGYDDGVYPELLCSFDVDTGKGERGDSPFSLYEYEFYIL